MQNVDEMLQEKNYSTENTYLKLIEMGQPALNRLLEILKTENVNSAKFGAMADALIQMKPASAINELGQIALDSGIQDERRRTAIEILDFIGAVDVLPILKSALEDKAFVNRKDNIVYIFYALTSVGTVESITTLIDETSKIKNSNHEALLNVPNKNSETLVPALVKIINDPATNPSKIFCAFDVLMCMDDCPEQQKAAFECGVELLAHKNTQVRFGAANYFSEFASVEQINLALPALVKVANGKKSNLQRMAFEAIEKTVTDPALKAKIKTAVEDIRNSAILKFKIKEVGKEIQTFAAGQKSHRI